MAATSKGVGVVLSQLSKTMDEGVARLQLAAIEVPTPGDDEVCVRVRASGLNFFDLLMTQGKYQHKPELPFTMGSEAAGVVTQVGRGVTTWRAGDEVLLGMVSGGATASHVLAHSQALLPKPAGYSFEEAAGLAVGFLTGYHGLVHRGQLAAGQVLLVTGAGGGMGLSAVQIGRALGATVIACASSEEKRQRALQCGAHHAVGYDYAALRRLVEDVTDGRMLDVVYEVVGGAVLKDCVRLMGAGGRLLVVGFASGDIPAVPANLVLIKGFQLVGVRSGAEMALNPDKAAELWAAMKDMTSGARARQLAPVVQTWPARHFRDAYQAVASRSIIGKAIIVWPDDQTELDKLTQQSARL